MKIQTRFRSRTNLFWAISEALYLRCVFVLKVGQTAKLYDSPFRRRCGEGHDLAPLLRCSGDCHGDFKTKAKTFRDCVHFPIHQAVVLGTEQTECDRSHVRILSDVNDHVFAIQVIHKRNDPKLPYQAVVIRQSAMHRKGRNATADGGGVDPHLGSGSIPSFNCIGFVYFIRVDSKSSKNSRQ